MTGSIYPPGWSPSEPPDTADIELAKLWANPEYREDYRRMYGSGVVISYYQDDDLYIAEALQIGLWASGPTRHEALDQLQFMMIDWIEHRWADRVD